MQVEDDGSLFISPRKLSLALSDALCALRNAHVIIVCAFEGKSQDFNQLENYLGTMESLMAHFSEQGSLVSAFLEKAAECGICTKKP